jgi:succinate dehydrogenase / fumarate reductase flavoprotein subunit
VGESGLAVYLDFEDTIKREGVEYIREQYGNLFDMYERITGENAYRTPMRIFPAVHYVMGGLWVDYNLMSTIPGLFVLGEANFSDHGANRLGASALMQGLADGYFVIPYTLGDYLATSAFRPTSEDADEFKQSADQARGRLERLLSIQGKRTPREFHREIGRIMWDYVGMARNEAGLKHAIREIRRVREELWQDLKVPGSNDMLNKNLELASRIADYAELGELMAIDALHRKESCGGHFREESQTPEGEAKRDDAMFSYVAAWEYPGAQGEPTLHREPLSFEYVVPTQRTYK